MTDRPVNYSPDPGRCIHIQGVIDQALVYRLTPEIISLQSKSDAPITVYIDSPGGVVAHMESILQLLRFKQNTDDPQYFVTVVTSQAASAAADMLAAGNYAFAYRDSRILYHGVRTPNDHVLTVEETLQLAQRLKAGNENYAMELVRQAEFRAMFRFISLKGKFPELKEEHPDWNDLQCLVSLSQENLSASGFNVLSKAMQRHSRYNTLLTHVAARCKPPSTYKSRARAEAAQIRAILTFECQNMPNKEWTFYRDGMQRLSDDFFLLHEYLRMWQGSSFRRLCDIFSDFLLTDAEQEEVSKLSDDTEKRKAVIEKARPVLQPIWSFFVALCHVLQEGENQLNGIDAFWLGLIDEVVGVPNLPYFRLWVEHSRQGAKDEQEQIESKAVESEAAEVIAGA